MTLAFPQTPVWRDDEYMAAALTLGRRELGATAPNPSVGALVVRDGAIVGGGFTRPGGRPHAETEALAQAGPHARGATLYVTLEPCSHRGHTPPCAAAIIDAGVSRVVCAMEDPDPRVAGRGIAMLRAAGVEVVCGVLADAARRAHRGHILRVTQGRPMVTLKLAETADGYAAGDAHDARLMITGEAADNLVKVARAQSDAVMVGIGTALADDPLMTVRLPGLADRRPLRVVLDTHLRLSPRSRLAATAHDCPTLLIAAEGMDGAALEACGVAIARAPRGVDGRLDLAAALALLAARGVTRVFSEGGPSVAARLIALDLIDEAIMIKSPKPFGRRGVAALSAEARARLSDARAFTLTPAMAGPDVVAHYERIV